MYFIEKLTVYSWLFSVLPEIQRRSKADKDQGNTLLYYVDASCQGLWLSRSMAAFLKIEIKRLDFTFFDAKDKNGDFLWWTVMFEDLADLQKYMFRYPALQEIIQKNKADEHLRFFLMRRILYFDSSLFILMHILLVLRVASLKRKKEERINVFLFSSQRPWLSQVKKWAEARNVNIIPMRRGRGFSVKEIMAGPGFIKHSIKQVLFAWMGTQKALGMAGQGDQRHSQDLSPKIAVEFYGHLNLDSPQLSSDLFFCQQASTLNKDILIYFQHPVFPVSDQAWDEIKAHGMSAVVMNPRATTTSRVPLFNYVGQLREEDRSRGAADDKGKDDIRRDLSRQVAEYYKQKDYWSNFFARHNIKMHVSWYKIESKYFPMADALNGLGGVSVIYQRSFESDSNPWMVTKADVVFGFSKFGAHLGKDTDSVIPYYVVTGYLGDHRYPILKKEASVIRHDLQRHGANRILAYFDESSVDDPRWNIGHQVTQENYAFLLKKILDTPSLGLIFKPKIYSNLRKRLGEDIADLLDRAQETGRCYIFKEVAFHLGSHPPAIAALASDIAIHGHLCAATAGVESALTGTPTLMLDREGCSKSPVYQLGEGRVVFKNWDDLWKACLDHWGHSDGRPGFGDWSPMLDELDPFRDGRAAQRMGSYLEWISQGLKAKIPREMILADAAQRYAKIWGQDKVLAINHGRL
ncbi:MAG: hypothetical protein Q7K71_03215 [Candidatus Omnitrophota bacterium]|nr:hypothetical protein [Candidatus Omnitrophota bacterium]